MKKALLVGTLLLVVAVLMGACAGPSIDEAKADYCQKLGEFGQAVATLRQVDENSTVDELKSAQDQMGKAWDELSKASGALRDTQFDEMEQAYKNLDKTIKDIPEGEATLGEVQQQVRAAVLATLAESVDIAATTCVYGGEGQ